MRPPILKCVLIGDHTDSYYYPSVFDPPRMDFKIDGKSYKLELWDTSVGPDDDYVRLRPLSYPQTDVFLFLYSTVDPASLDHLRDKWYPEVRRHCPYDAAFVVAATKSDLRTDDSPNSQTLVPSEQGTIFAEEINAYTFAGECSAVTLQGVHLVFELCARAAISKKPLPKKSASCALS